MMGSLLLACSGGSGAGAGTGVVERTGCVLEALQQCPSQSLEGIDVFDGQGAIDWPAVADAGVAFAVIKATQGTYDTQATFAFNWRAARLAGLRRAAYHFFDPTDDGAAQARQFLDSVTAAEPGDLPPVLDIECPDGDADCLGTGDAGKAPPAMIAARMWDWIHTVETATGARPVVYTFADYFASNGIDPAGLEAYPLFLAQPAHVAAAACISVPAPWSRATLWQYSWSGSVSGIGVPVDRDRFLGTAADLAVLAWGPAHAPAVPPAGPIAASLGPPQSAAPSGSPGCP